MRSLKAFLLVLMCFCTFNSKLLAKEIITLTNATQLTQIPDSCLKTREICALKTSPNEKFKINFGNSQIVLDENTAIIRKSETSLVLVSGQIWVRAQSAIKIETEFGSTETDVGNFLILSKAKKMDVQSIDANLILKPKMPQKALRLEAGERNWLGPVDQNRNTTSGVPLPVRPQELALNWSRLYTGTKKDFEKDFKNFFALWSSSSEKLAVHHAEITQRQLASIEEEKARKKRIKADQDREDRRFKEWFRKLVLSE